jgi:aminopeptidase N
MPNSNARPDLHSFAIPAQARVRHVSLDLTVDFTRRILDGAAELKVEGPGPLTLDSRDLDVLGASVWDPTAKAWREADAVAGKPDSLLGTPLTIETQGAPLVRIRYRTSPDAKALQWLEPSQTLGQKHPFLFTQSQSIHARSWAPLQDSPGIRITYSARIRTPKELFAVMSADNTANVARTGDYRFEMPNPVPPYLLALAVGDLEFRPISNRTGVYAEPGMVDRAAKEFEDTEKMVQATEAMYGPYRWGRYDILVCPPSFPFGGMENPRLTFVTPTLIAGDKSLVSVISHELAHSWSGNLVTNATWRDFWLNEGVTTYIENRIQEKLFGPERAAKERLIELDELRAQMKELPPGDQHLWIDLDGRDPDDGATLVPYVKGASLLREIEQALGRERFDQFIRAYFNQFAFQSITTADFLQFLRLRAPGASAVPLEEWIYRPGVPKSGTAPAEANPFQRIDDLAKTWTPARAIDASGWSTPDYLRFLNALPAKLGADRMRALDEALKLSQTQNAEIERQWLEMAIVNQYEPGLARLEEFLTKVGRMKFVRPLYRALCQTPEGKARAQGIFAKARPGYHPLTAQAVAGILGN